MLWETDYGPWHLSRTYATQFAMSNEWFLDLVCLSSVNRPVRTRIPGDVGDGGETLPPTRFDNFNSIGSRLLDLQEGAIYSGFKVPSSGKSNAAQAVCEARMAKYDSEVSISALIRNNFR